MAEHVVPGYVHGELVHAAFMASMLGLQHGSAATVDAVIEIGSGPNLSRGRNMLVSKFLAEQSAPWLFMADTDMVFAPDVAARLIACGQPVVGALCYGQDPAGGDPLPVMYELVEDGGRPAFARASSWPEDALVRVSATGAACLLMHRDALEAIRHAGGDEAAPWFRESVMGGKLIGEDLTFCLRAGVAKVPVHVHTGVQAGHIKPVMLGKVT